jgi:hypothetical protein
MRYAVSVALLVGLLLAGIAGCSGSSPEPVKKTDSPFRKSRLMKPKDNGPPTDRPGRPPR